jgi:hypothetical protein
MCLCERCPSLRKCDGEALKAALIELSTLVPEALLPEAFVPKALLPEPPFRAEDRLFARELCRDPIEQTAEMGPDLAHNRDDGNADPRDEEPIFGGRRGVVVGGKLCKQRLHAPTPHFFGMLVIPSAAGSSCGSPNWLRR